MVLKYDIEWVWMSVALHGTQKVNSAGGFCVTCLVNSTENLWLAGAVALVLLVAGDCPCFLKMQDAAKW